jgi:nucleolin
VEFIIIEKKKKKSAKQTKIVWSKKASYRAAANPKTRNNNNNNSFLLRQLLFVERERREHSMGGKKTKRDDDDDDVEAKKLAKKRAKKMRKMKAQEENDDEKNIGYDNFVEVPDADDDEYEGGFEDDGNRKEEEDKEGEEEEKQKEEKKKPPKPGEFPLSNTKVYVGNLSWQIDDESLKRAFVGIGEIKSIVWMEEKLTKKFLGAGVVEFHSEEEATKAVENSGRMVLKRECKIRRWEQRGNTAEERKAAAERGESLPNSNQKEKNKKKFPEMGEKPHGCYTLFMGNLDFNMTDDFIWDFFKQNAGVEMIKVRWLENRDTGEFRGQGYADFKKDEIDQAATLHNTPCMGGRPIKLDWQAPRGSR